MSNQWQPLVPMTSYKTRLNGVLFSFGKSQLELNVLQPDLLRARYAFDGTFAARRSWAVAKDDSEYPQVAFSVQEDGNSVTVATDTLSARVRRADGGIEFYDVRGNLILQDYPEDSAQYTATGFVRINRRISAGENFYGFGERTGLLEKRGKRYTCWATDPVDRSIDHGPGADALYQSHPFYISLQATIGGYGIFFNNSFKTVFDIANSHADKFTMDSAGGELDYYFIYGPQPARILESYSGLVGRTPLPPRWALGYHQSRWSYYPEGQVRELAAEFRQRQIPGEVIHLDIDYMNGYRVFSWDAERFPDPKQLCADLEAQGFKVVLIVDPGVKFDPNAGYHVFDEGFDNDYFVRNADGSLFQAYVWPDLSVFPDFAKPVVQQWWGKLHKQYLEAGVKGIWNDMNELAMSNAPFSEPGAHLDMPDNTPQGPENELANHAELHNLYGYLEDRATYEGLLALQPDTRPFLLTRSGFSGIQRYSAVWTGDNTACWEHLEMSIPQLANLGLSGVPFVGADIGGFFGASGVELWGRWIELGAFYPFSRGHSCINTPQKEPWAWGAEVEQIARNYLEWRYRLLPYLYNLFEESSRTGAPVWRPLVYHFYEDSATFQLHDQIMIGEALMLAPVYRPGVTHRAVYFPAGQWYNFWTGEAITATHLLAPAPFDVLPAYARGGTIIPLAPVAEYSDQKPFDKLTLQVYLDSTGHAQGRLYEDDGESLAYTRDLSCSTTYTATTEPDGHITVRAERSGNFQPLARSVDIWVFTPHGNVLIKLEADSGNWEVSGIV